MGNHLIGDGLRFIAAGGINTLLTLGVYQLALFFMPHNLAYAASWIVGILFLVIVYPTRVFPGGRTSKMRNAVVVTIYLLVFLISLWSLEFVISIGLHKRLAIFVILVLSASLNFVLIRRVYRI
jgi:putative flippase GtrA